MRYFLIDKVTELVIGQRATGVKNITLADEVLNDHFPDYPVMPGALIVESAAQLGGFLLEMTYNSHEGSPLLRAMLIQIDRAKFYRTAGPGDRLDISAAIDSRIDTAAKVDAVIKVDMERIATAALTFTMKSIDSERLHEQRRYLYKLWTRDLGQSLVIR